ncbi:hypothetical protein ACKFKH_28020 [Phormidesmis sp. 146-20]
MTNDVILLCPNISSFQANLENLHVPFALALQTYKRVATADRDLQNV